MAVEQKKILIRRGNKADLVLTDLQPGEQVLALDTNEVGIKTSGGDMIWYATKESGPNAAVLASEKGVANGVATTDADNKVIQQLSTSVINAIYLAMHLPGTIVVNTTGTNPGTIFGGTWVAWGAGRVPVGVDANDTDFNAAEKTGGEKTHTLITNEMPSHAHDLGIVNPSVTAEGTGYRPQWAYNCAFTVSQSTGNTGGDQPHNNLQPYETCYMWKRTA